MSTASFMDVARGSTAAPTIPPHRCAQQGQVETTDIPNSGTRARQVSPTLHPLGLVAGGGAGKLVVMTRTGPRVSCRATMTLFCGLTLACTRTAGLASDPHGTPSVVGDRASRAELPGSYRWLTMDDRSPPVEFPAGSGATLVDGLLELHAPDAGAGARFGLRFTMRPTARDSAKSSGEDGNYSVMGDSLLFMPDGREDRPPVRFRYAWGAGGRLLLTDSQGHVWAYTRR